MLLRELDLLTLQTKAMQRDDDVIAFTTALNRQYRDIAAQIEKALIYGNVDNLPEPVLDILAWQFKVAWYDATSALEVKQQAINDALIVARMLGTPAAVEKVVEIYFGDGKVEEWFEYAGQPYHFRIVTNNPDANSTKAALLIKAVDSVKRKSTRLDSVIIQSVESMDLYEGLVLHMTDNLTLKQVV